MTELTKEQAVEMLRSRLELQDGGEKPDVLEALRKLLNEVMTATRHSVDKYYTTTPLHEAAGAGDLEQVRRLLDLGADVNAQQGLNFDDPYNIGGLHWSHDQFFVRFKLGLTPLGRCFTDYDHIRKDDLMARLEIAELLMEHGASANVPYQQNRSVFIHMIKLCHDHANSAPPLFIQHKKEEIAIREKLLKLIEQALNQISHWSNESAVTNFYGLSNQQMIKLCYDNPCPCPPVFIRQDEGKTSIGGSLKRQIENVLGNIKQEYGKTATADYSRFGDQREKLNPWYGSPTEKLDNTFYQWQQCPHPFDVCGAGDDDIMELLLKNGFDVNSAEGTVPPLFSHATDEYFVDFLVEHGADVNRIYQSRTPLLYLLSDDFKPCEGCYYTSTDHIFRASEHLVKLGADINAVGPDGVSAKEHYERKRAKYQKELDNEPDWEALARREEAQADRRSLQEMLDEYGGDEDAMHNSPEYWDYMEGLADLD